MFHEFHTRPILFTNLARGMNRPAKVSQPSQFLLNSLQTFMPLPVRDLGERSITLLTPVLFVLFVELGNLGPQAHNFIFQNLQMIHVVRIPSFLGQTTFALEIAIHQVDASEGENGRFFLKFPQTQFPCQSSPTRVPFICALDRIGREQLLPQQLVTCR